MEPKDAIYTRIPKTGGVSLIYQLLEQDACLNVCPREFSQVKEWKGVLAASHSNMTIAKNQGLIPLDFWNKAIKFSVVRNPYARMVSIWQYTTQQLGFWHRLPVIQFREFVRIVDRVPFMVPPVGVYATKRYSFANKQVDWLRDGEDGAIEMDYLGRLENHALWAELSGLLKVTLTKRHENKSKRQQNHRCFYDDSTKRIVTRLYEEDLDTFKYTY